jgi:hypothetical protein
MSVASPRPPAAPLNGAAHSSPVSNSAAEVGAEWWVEILKWGALAVFVAVPVFSLLVQPLAGRVVWTIVVAALPLFIVLVGYHRWRRICPLAFFAQIPVRLRRPGTRKASPWLEKNYYRVACAVFFVSLWLRLIATNGDGAAIALFFILLTLCALVFGATYTGKTWCNYICPVSFIEKIYTEPHGLRETENSQCEKCSACKKFCPDINEENGYWKEIEARPKRAVYYLFPGLVFGFYFYYYLQAGTWDYYFGGSWTNQPGLFRTAFLPGQDGPTAGFFFLPGVPRALAAILTLATFALASYVFFSLLEPLVGKLLRRRDVEADASRVRHIMLSLAAFTAFVTFYSFAGQPSLRKIRLFPAPHLILVVVVFTATLFLIRRLHRTPKTFAEEALARNIIKRWEWTDMQPPKDLHEAFLIHTIRSRESARGSAQGLLIYKDAVRETLANGFVTRDEMHLLESLRNQLQIKPADHEKVMAALAEEERAMMSDPSKQISAEKRLQLETYSHALKKYLEEVLDAKGNPDESFIVQLRAEYGVTKDEHAAVLDQLLDQTGGMAARLAEELRTIARSAQTNIALELSPSPTHDFLAGLLRRRQARAVESLLRGLSFTLEDERQAIVRDALCGADESLRESIVEKMRAILPPAIAEQLVNAYRETVQSEASLPTLTDMLYARLQNPDPYVRAAALYALGERGAADQKTLESLNADEHAIVRETASHLMEREGQKVEGTATHAGLITIEKMIALRSAPIFSRLAPEGLAQLARACREEAYAPDENLCVEGEQGNEVFILLTGDVRVLIKDTNEVERIVNSERAGGFIGELAVLDPAPRSATVRAGSLGTRVLRLDGEAFRQALDADPSIATSVINTLARRLRETHKHK